MTLGPNKGTYRPGRGLRWVKIRQPGPDLALRRNAPVRADIHHAG